MLRLQRGTFRVYQHDRQGGRRADLHARFLGPALKMTPPGGGAFAGDTEVTRPRARAPAPQKWKWGENYKLQVAKLQIAKYKWVQFFCRLAGLSAGESWSAAACLR